MNWGQGKRKKELKKRSRCLMSSEKNYSFTKFFEQMIGDKGMEKNYLCPEKQKSLKRIFIKKNTLNQFSVTFVNFQALTMPFELKSQRLKVDKWHSQRLKVDKIHRKLIKGFFFFNKKSLKRCFFTKQILKCVFFFTKNGFIRCFFANYSLLQIKWNLASLSLISY